MPSWKTRLLFLSFALWAVVFMITDSGWHMAMAVLFGASWLISATLDAGTARLDRVLEEVEDDQS